MDFTTIITPLIGAGIGYITNYIAVKMLFRPLKPVKIGQVTLPFTPGIIPKEKDRLAKGIADIVGERLVTKEGIEKALLSEDVKKIMQEKIEAFFDSDVTLEDFLTVKLSAEKYEELKSSVSKQATQKIADMLKDSDIGSTMAKEIISAIKDYVSGGFLAMMLNDSLLTPIGEHIAKAINSYLETNGETLIAPYVENGTDTLTQLTLQDVKQFCNTHNIDIKEILYNLCISAIQNNLDSILSIIDVRQITENQIQQMDVLELEELLLTVMKKELNAIVNLGALIGLILGMLNLVI